MTEQQGRDALLARLRSLDATQIRALTATLRASNAAASAPQAVAAMSQQPQMSTEAVPRTTSPVADAGKGWSDRFSEWVW